jgi:hypothetical protein
VQKYNSNKSKNLFSVEDYLHGGFIVRGIGETIVWYELALSLWIILSTKLSIDTENHNFLDNKKRGAQLVLSPYGRQ